MSRWSTRSTRSPRSTWSGSVWNINVSLLANDGDCARPGDWVLIHVGFALSKVDEEEARATLALLQRMGRDYEQWSFEQLKASVIE